MTAQFNKTIGAYDVKIFDIKVSKLDEDEPLVVSAKMLLNDDQYCFHEQIVEGALCIDDNSRILSLGIFGENSQRWMPMPNYAHDFRESFAIAEFMRESLQTFVASQSPLVKAT
jgi:hypothetical protein